MKLLLIIFIIINIPYAFSQSKECYFDKEYWIPSLEKDPKNVKVQHENTKYNIYYRINNDKTSFFIEKIELLDKQEIIEEINNKKNVSEFMSEVLLKFYIFVAKNYKWMTINDSLRELKFEVIKKVYWKFSKNKNDFKNIILGCRESMCYNEEITFTDKNGVFEIKKQKFVPIESENFYNEKEFEKSDCFFIVDRDE